MSSHRLRLGRRSIIGQAYVLTTTTHQRRRLLESDALAACVIDQFDYIEQRGLVRSHAWVVMPDHVHWMFELHAADLPDIARRMKSSSALALNRLAGRRSTVWQPGYFDHAVRTEESLARQALYILGNPVRAGIAKQIGEYPYAWSAWM
ncbi:REP-associated tyrosine transposase [Stenotrophomonas maltophilia]|uniref:REP-associated tyrosine transposase n=1 Tax=Stenotrophomonas maltophilia TaxID=40324 RepID=UPI00066E0FBF|nr:transposase [Stenotrophomonas maltophilia]